MTTRQRPAYTRAGVSVSAGERAVALMRASVESTHRFADVVGAFGGFGAAVRLPGGLEDPLLVSSTDGVGTKTAIARALRRFHTIGIDLVAMCADDVVCTGAAPLFFLDYVAVGRIVPEGIAQLVGSIARGCELAECALVGGETAEHPGLLEGDAFDLAGCCVGVVEAGRLIDGSAVRADDAVLGLGASGLHSNGFSLVRTLVTEHDLNLSRPYQAQVSRTLGEAAREAIMAAEPEHELSTLGEVLLEPTRIYAPAVLELRRRLERRGADLHAIVHITGGGLSGNLPRVLPDGLGVRIDPSAWPMPSVMRLFGALGGVEDDELRATFNGGVGMAVILPASAAEGALDDLRELGVAAWSIGSVERLAELGGQRYVESPAAAGLPVEGGR